MTKYNVTYYFGYDELPENVKLIEGPPYAKYDMHGYLVIRNIDGSIKVYRDGGEPEDQRFSRDWKWVRLELMNAYKQGLNS
jgi:hypothetical protein